MSGEAASDPLERRSEAELQALLESFLGRCHRGEAPSVEEYARAHPALADKIREFFPLLLALEGARSGSGSRTQDVATVARVGAGGGSSLQRLGEYRIVRDIGRGGMGIVYEAEQESLGRTVALKVLPFHCLLDPRRLERFRLEARAAAGLQHPNIVPVHAFGECDGIYYYAMQRINGQGFDAILPEVKRLRSRANGGAPAPAPPAGTGTSSTTLAMSLLAGDDYCHNAVRLCRDVARALAYAHGQGVIHRDIKPSNLLLDAAGAIYVTDFGLAKVEDAGDLTFSGEVIGTLSYMAPERFRGQSDPRSDIYSLGVTLHEVLTLERAFDASDRSELVRKISQEYPPPLSRVDSRIPPELDAVVLRAIQKDPERRYQESREMAEDLERFLAGRRPRAKRLPLRGPSSARRRRVAATAILALLAALLLAWGVPAIFTRRAASPEVAPVKYEVGALPDALVAADLDGDGDLDLATANIGSSDVTLFLNDGRGAFPARETMDVGDQPLVLVACDLDGTGGLDLATANIAGDSVSVLLHQGGSSFAAARNVPAGKAPAAVAAADLDGDGAQELIAASKGSKCITVVLNEGSGNFKDADPLTVALDGEPWSVAAGDLNGDGEQDLAAAGGAKSLWIAFASGRATFAAAEKHAVGSFPNSVEMLDLNGDGRLDIVTANAGFAEEPRPDSVSVLRNQGEGAFSPAAHYPAGDRPIVLRGADLDDDGDLDLAVANSGSNNVSFLLNDGQGAFLPAGVIPAGEGARAPAISDFDANGDLDLAVVNRNDNSLWIYLNPDFPALLRRGIAQGSGK